jgi:hypothetical protein
MSDWLHGVRVPPLRIAQLRELAALVRGGSQLRAEEPFPVLYFLEHSLPQAVAGFDFVVVDRLSNGDEACAYPDGCVENPDGPFIKLTTAVYNGAWANNGRDRLTVLHECSHVILHRKVAVHHRGPRGADLKPYENSEWQANQLAAELLMPVEAVAAYPSLREFCRRMGVSREAAQLRARKLIERGDVASIDWL